MRLPHLDDRQVHPHLVLSSHEIKRHRYQHHQVTPKKKHTLTIEFHFINGG